MMCVRWRGCRTQTSMSARCPPAAHRAGGPKPGIHTPQLALAQRAVLRLLHVRAQLRDLLQQRMLRQVPRVPAAALSAVCGGKHHGKCWALVSAIYYASRVHSHVDCYYPPSYTSQMSFEDNIFLLKLQPMYLEIGSAVATP